MNDDKFSQTASEVHDVWNAIDGLRSDVVSIKTSLARLGSQMDSVSESTRSVIQGQKTPWGVILAGIGVSCSLAVSVGGAALAPLYLSDRYNSELMKRDIGRLDGDVAEIRGDIGSRTGLRFTQQKLAERVASLEAKLNSEGETGAHEEAQN